MKGLDLTGKIIGKQKVICEVGKDKNGHYLWRVKCACGNIRTVPRGALTSKNRPILSCRLCSVLIHGCARRRKRDYLYNTWLSMKDRCNNKNNKDYKYYGGRGICVYEKWNSFLEFKYFIEKNLGKRPYRHTLDRIDNNGNYEPENVRWATISQQNNNKGIISTNTSGYTGVSFNKISKKWVSYVSINKKTKRIGAFLSIKKAIEFRNIYIDKNNLFNKKNSITINT